MQLLKWHVGYWTILLFLISSRNIVQSDATSHGTSSHGTSRNLSRNYNKRRSKKRKTYSRRSRHYLDSNSDSFDLLGSSSEKEKLFSMDSSEEDKIIMALANEDDSRDYEIKPRRRSSSSSRENKKKRKRRQHSHASSSALSSNSSRDPRKKSKSTKRVKTSKSKKSKGGKIRSGEKTFNDKKDSADGYTPSKRKNRTTNTMKSSKERNDSLSKHGNDRIDEKRKRISNSQRVSSSKGVSRERKVDMTSKVSSEKQPNSTWNDEKEHESTIEIIRKVREQANLNAIKTPATEETTTVGNTDIVEKKEEKGDDSTSATTTTNNTVKHSMEQLQNGALDAKGSTATKPAVIEKKESIQTKPMKVQPPRISTTTVDGTTTTKVIPTTHKSTATASIPTVNVEVSPSKTATSTPVSKINRDTATTTASTTYQSQTKQQQQQQQQAPPTTMSMTTPWARKFILSRPKDALLPIPREFLSDGFNLVQLGPIVEKAVQAMNLQGKDSSTIQEKENQSALSNLSLYKSALKLILEEADMTEDASIAYNHAIYSATQIQKAAEVLYTLVHARYVSSPRGLDTIRRMFLRNAKMNVQKKSNEHSASSTIQNTEIGAIFGRCSRIQCKGTPFLPIGLSDRYDIGETEGQMRKAMRLCPCCRETFVMWDSRVDGAAWGTSFAYLFLMTQGSNVFGKHYGKIPGERDISHCKSNDRIFGFPIHAAAAINASN
ncbi:hypothetical protein CTEN210_17919 [Chaetoceros tenuissimus]|uniref:Casein kinase II subunit beta n=1 Tax=Chaetoceros tenuissimus TaxID=426638 RepID=A0AAD3HFU8_9STRA|nr:hypothetical protein CTEN210_17919 [Chaetoceros tenuissimus]